MTFVHRLRLKQGRHVETHGSIVALKVRSHTRVPTQPRPGRCANHRPPNSSSRPVVGSFSNRQGATNQCSRCYSLHMACFSFSSSLFFSLHGPFNVRSAQLFHRSSGFTQLLLPSGWSQPVLTLVCFCFLFWISDVASIQQMSHHLVVECGTMVSRISILQTCNDVVVLKQSLASFQHLHIFDVRTFFILRSAS